MSLRSKISYAAGKGSGWALRLTRRSGTTLPGYLAERIDEDALREAMLHRDYSLRILVTGTNGKTTTTRLIAKLLAAADWSVAANQAGSNLYRGVLTTVLRKQPSSGRRALLLEVDEASLPRVAAAIRPTHIVVLNLFRDQLDRYGEVSTTQAYIAEAFEGLTTTAILCADDPWVAMLPKLVDIHKVSYFGLDLKGLKALPHDQAADYPLSPKSHVPLKYSKRYFSHLGDYQAVDKSWQRPVSDVIVTKLNEIKEQIEIDYVLRKKHYKISSLLHGVYNAYNFAAVATLASVLEIDPKLVAHVAADTTPAFGRQEVVEDGGFEYQLFLIKNPTGFNQVIQSAFQDSKDLRPTLIAINDNFADGRDVSWLWDSAIEDMQCTSQIVVTGTRAYDMALRLEYAGRACRVVPDLNQALDELKSHGQRLRILPTYTALLELRHLLGLSLGDVE